MNKLCFIDDVVKAFLSVYDPDIITRHVNMPAEAYMKKIIKCISMLQCCSGKHVLRHTQCQDTVLKEQCTNDYNHFLSTISQLFKTKSKNVDIDIMRCMAYQAAVILHNQN